MPQLLRVAFFTDCFHELNGVGTLSRELVSYAKRRGISLCCVHAGPETRVLHEDSVTTIELKRGLTFTADQGLYCDIFLSRHRNWAMKQLAEFQPDLIHITGPGDVGVLGLWIAKLMGIPRVSAWHTNLHEYAGRRIHKTLEFAPQRIRAWGSAATERQAFRALVAFYRLAHFIVAPNQDTVDLLKERTGCPTYLMKHGVDTTRFSPCRKKERRDFCVGSVGRLTPEKNVRAFADLERQLLAAGAPDFRMLLVGDGSEREWLRAHCRSVSLPGFLEGDALADAFASMDAFVFPSQTDTFGLVILEALASGVPVVLSPEAGARVGIRHGVEGFLSDNLSEGVLSVMRCKDQRQSMSIAAQRFAEARSWDGVFDDLYEIYGAAIDMPEVQNRIKTRSVVSI